MGSIMKVRIKNWEKLYGNPVSSRYSRSRGNLEGEGKRRVTSGKLQDSLGKTEGEKIKRVELANRPSRCATKFLRDSSIVPSPLTLTSNGKIDVQPTPWEVSIIPRDTSQIRGSPGCSGNVSFCRGKDSKDKERINIGADKLFH